MRNGGYVKFGEPHAPTYASELTADRDGARQRFKRYQEEPGDLEILRRWGILSVLDMRGNVREVPNE